jgi:hypothetical protein
MKRDVGFNSFPTKNLIYVNFFPNHYSVAVPDPSNPNVFGTPGSRSGSVSMRYGSGSSFESAPDSSIIKQK